MSHLNADLEPGLDDEQPVNRNSQSYLLDNQNQENRENPIEDLRSTFEYSAVFNFIALSIPSAKIIASLLILITGDYPCIGTKQVWLICMLVHDALHAFIIGLRLNIIVALSRLNSNNNESNENNNNENGFQQEIQLGERVEGNMPQQQHDEEAQIPNQNNQPNQRNRNLNRSNSTMEILIKRDRVGKLTTLCTYVWMFLFLFWLEMGAIHVFGDCDTQQINNLVYVYVIMAWIWLLNPLIICVSGCLCLPVLIILLVVFRKPQQQPATQNELNNLSVKPYTSDIPGNKECAICMGDYQEGEMILQLQCSPLHHFHEDCIKSWLRINGQCPVCRARIGH